MMMAAELIQDKYQSANPAMRFVLGRFFAAVGAELAGVDPKWLLDAGCGEGELARRGLYPAQARVVSLDILHERLVHFHVQRPEAALCRASITKLPLPDKYVDAAVSLEVLEHLAEPALAMAELVRVTRGRVIVSVPHEPWFRLANLARGKYPGTWGNHPEHVQHWSPASFRRFLSPWLEDLRVSTPFPWIVASGHPR